MPGPSKVPHLAEQNAKLAQALGAAADGSGGAEVNGNQADSVVSKILKKTLMDVSDRSVRGVVNRMLDDGSLIDGLQRALEANASHKFAPPTPDVGQGDHRAAMQEKNRLARGTPAGTSSQVDLPANRYEQFLTVIDVDIDRISSLIAGLEDRLSFVTYDGPSEPRQTTDAGGTSLGPSNRLETELHDRGRRLAIVRDRLEQLHTNLRI